MTGNESVQCEMCGTETASPNRIKVEGATLDVCDDCTDFGTAVQTESSSSTSTKYSTGSGSGGGSSGGSSGGESSTSTASTTNASSGGGGGGGGPDIFDEMAELAQDFDERIRAGRERAGLSQEDLADELNEKASLIRKLEHGDTLPTDEIQQKLERRLDIDLDAGGEAEETEWESEQPAGEYTLGDVVERKDS